MAGEFMEVRPGQIISSALFNSLFTTLMTRMEDLEARVADLEGGTGGGADAVAITGFSPPAQAKQNEVLAILGRGFIFPPLAAGVPTNTLMLDGVQINAFLFDSSTERLSFVIPAALAITTPTTITIQVGNELGESQPRTYLVLPPDPITVPQPTIAQVAPKSVPALSNTVIVGQVAVVDGTNFLTDATTMTVAFTVPAPAGGSPHTYPVATTGVTAVSATRFEVMVPDMSEVPAVGNRVVILSVLAQGNAVAGTKTIQARRS
jgi:hypothetical protein